MAQQSIDEQKMDHYRRLYRKKFMYTYKPTADANDKPLPLLRRGTWLPLLKMGIQFATIYKQDTRFVVFLTFDGYVKGTCLEANMPKYDGWEFELKPMPSAHAERSIRKTTRCKRTCHWCYTNDERREARVVACVDTYHKMPWIKELCDEDKAAIVETKALCLNDAEPTTGVHYQPYGKRGYIQCLD